MSLRNKLILSTFLISSFLFLITIVIFVAISYYHMKTFSYIQKILARNANEVFFDLGECGFNHARSYVLLREDGLYIGRVANCRFYGTRFVNGVEFTANVNDLSWFIAYSRDALERYAEGRPEFLDRFIRNRVVLRDFVLEGEYSPEAVKRLGSSATSPFL